ncbi:YgaP-like transmembrane domain [Pararcticibacter amylolyticus]|uniref:Cyclase/dehydrase n=1 Tax=Pararcticibacter amylolyticus TaxID=2173175 RepID=A0A2U2PB91_9SPHI|nr:YgaP-like transmembrane domain [Pararcticibacter amylolyticus]PWG78668.1 cyclase/dehydrase [Pararcticibacter amylolyticus]
MALVYPELREEGKTGPLYGSHTGSVNINKAERMFSLLAGTVLLYNGITQITKKPFTAASKLVAGGALLVRAVSGHCAAYAAAGKNSARSEAINIRQQFTVNRPRAVVFHFWRSLENLPLFMRHLEKVEKKEDNLWLWKAKFSDNFPAISWNAEIVKEKEGYFIGWQSVDNAIIDHAGKVEFNDAANGHGTEVQVVFTYRAPAGTIGTGIARLLNPFVEKLILEDVLNFKQYIEAGEIPENSTASPEAAV